MRITKVASDDRYLFIRLNDKNTFRIDRFRHISECSRQLMRIFIIFISLFVGAFADKGDGIQAKIKAQTGPKNNNPGKLKKDIRIPPIEIELLRIIRVIIPIPVFPFSPMWDLSRHLGKGYIHIYLFTIDDVASPYCTVFMKLSDKARPGLLYDEISSIFFVPRLRFLKPLMFF